MGFICTRLDSLTGLLAMLSFTHCLALNLKISSVGSFLRFTSIMLRILEALYRKAEEGLIFLSSSELTCKLVASETSIEVSEIV